MITIYTTIFNIKNIRLNCVESVLKQTYSLFEWVVVYDDEADKEIFQQLCNNDERVRLIRNETPGRWNALKLAIDSSRTEYVFNQDFDDVASPNRIELQLKALKANAKISAVGGWYVAEYLDDNRKELHCDVNDMERIRKVLPFWLPFAHSFCGFKKSMLNSVGGYPLDCRLEDGIIWARLIAEGFEVCIVENYIGTHFIYDTSTFGKLKKNFSMEIVYLKERVKIRKILKLPRYYDILLGLRVLYRYLPNRVQFSIRRMLGIVWANS